MSAALTGMTHGARRRAARGQALDIIEKLYELGEDIIEFGAVELNDTQRTQIAGLAKLLLRAVQDAGQDPVIAKSPPAPDYDPASCVTAGELRAMGCAVPEKVPDCAWVPKSMVSYDLPFQWTELNGTITAPQG